MLPEDPSVPILLKCILKKCIYTLYNNIGNSVSLMLFYNPKKKKLLLKRKKKFSSTVKKIPFQSILGRGLVGRSYLGGGRGLYSNVRVNQDIFQFLAERVCLSVYQTN